MGTMKHLIKEHKGLKLERRNTFIDDVTLLSETSKTTAWGSIPSMRIDAYPARNASF